ncbi:ATP-binding cassette domain-containing protein [Microbacterium sp. NPDC076911]|uniref:ATP-binding cassette domain-containing protein n=1 Tax=Microbacterium sp. NPDC076911 TaxID=3154958 RepID=UPI0034382062
MTFRSGPPRAAAALAAGFVGVRVVYRVLFHGADGSGTVVLALPEYRLPAPLNHVVLLGPATTDGLWIAAASAMPIAITILLFGVINAIVDVPRLFARGSRRGPLKGIARTLAIAWAALPALADSVRRVRFAQRLRGERGGPRLLAPVLERTLERATAIAAALELRGLAGVAAEGDCEHPVSVLNVALRHHGLPAPAVCIDSLELVPGRLTLITGTTGSGKSTLLRALAGLHSHVDGGTISGRLNVVGHDRVATPPRNTARLIGVVLQNPREGFATERVRDEIGLTLELRGVSSLIVATRVDEIANRIGIESLLDRDVRSLSAGEATLVAIAAAIVEHPILLLVDEPLADLDSRFRPRIVELLSALAHDAGMSVVVAEHRHTDFSSVADERLDISDGTAAAVPMQAVASAIPMPARTSTSRETVALSANDITVTYGDTNAVRGVSLSVAVGEIIALRGANGAGKSSLLNAIALPPRETHITVTGVAATRRQIALVPDASDDLFVCTSVGAECARADRRARVPQGTTAARFADFLGHEVGSAAFITRVAQHPLDLSLGERRCLAISLQLVTAPPVLLIDEPTRGLDPAASVLVSAALSRAARDGAAVLMATHDSDFAAALADRTLTMENGTVSDEPQASTSRATRKPRQDAWPEPQPAPAQQVAPRGTTGGPLRSHRWRISAGWVALAAANLVAIAAFAWPLVAYAVPSQSADAVPVAAFALAPVAAIVVLIALDGSVRGAHTLALLGTLAAIGAAVRIVGTGVGGVEAVFILLILAGRAYGARFGLLLGLLTIALSTVVTGTFGPWTPFQMFACAWVGAGAGLLPRRMSGRAEIAMLSVYGVFASYAFGLIMNLWFWPFAIGTGSGVSYEAGAPIEQNLGSFFVYSLVSSTLTWDTLRAITTVIGLLVVGSAILAAFRRAKPLTAQQSTQRSGVEKPLRVGD